MCGTGPDPAGPSRGALSPLTSTFPRTSERVPATVPAPRDLVDPVTSPIPVVDPPTHPIPTVDTSALRPRVDS